MSSQATVAVMNMAQELTAEEFRLLALISEISGEYAGWLVVDALRILRRSTLTIGQMSRMLYALHCDKVIEIGAESPQREVLTIGKLRQELAFDSSPHLYVWIKGMPEPTIAEAEPTA